uniref:Uncharacterized protein n=1 Tax=Corethron hystrix TaxID=216773 RepID=A0A7S1BD76_9STRA|mmetsp:Transcript_22790/g.52229  ORF Transcript_22790/g.52229 Transcript_22790/m.52229 type:complete len:456 (+) Transcript_22790:131-1498(+)
MDMKNYIPRNDTSIVIPVASALNTTVENTSNHVHSQPLQKTIHITENTSNIDGARTITTRTECENAGCTTTTTTINETVAELSDDAAGLLALPRNRFSYLSIGIFITACLCALHTVAMFDHSSYNFENYDQTLWLFKLLSGVYYVFPVPLSYRSAKGFHFECIINGKMVRGIKSLVIASWVLYGFSILVWIDVIIYKNDPMMELITAIVLSVASWCFMHTHAEFAREISEASITNTPEPGRISVTTEHDTADGTTTVINETPTGTEGDIRRLAALPRSKLSRWSIITFAIACGCGFISTIASSIEYNGTGFNGYHDQYDDDFYFDESHGSSNHDSDDWNDPEGYEYYYHNRRIWITTDVFETLSGMHYNIAILLSFYSAKGYQYIDAKRIGSEDLMRISWTYYGLSILSWIATYALSIFTSYYVMHIIAMIVSVTSWSLMHTHAEFARKGSASFI